MPQPLSRVKPEADISIGPQSLHVFPQFLPRIMGVIAQWAHTDGDFANVFAMTLKTDIEVGVGVYQAFNGLEARRMALFAAAKKALPEWQQIALDAVWRATKASRDQRDRFAHHVWGYSVDLPNALLLRNPNVVIDRNISYRTGVEIKDGRHLISPKDFDREKVFVYREKDFERAFMDALEANRLVTYLYWLVSNLPMLRDSKPLLNEPLFQRAVEPLIREKSPAVQAQLRPIGDAPRGPKWKVVDTRKGRKKP